MRACTITTYAWQIGAGLALLGLAAGCAELLPSPSASPPETSRRAPAPPASGRPVDRAQVQRLQRTMLPLIKVMDNPIPVNRVKVGIMDDSQINAASAGNGEFYVTRGLLEKANDQQLAGVLAHEIAHDDLRHVAKAQTLGTGLSIGMVILDQIFPGAGTIASIPGRIVMNKYTQREEYAADRHGADLLQKVGMPREIMADTLSWLLQTSGGSSGGFFSTHPATADRIEALRRGQ
jgi:Zn-dependent protease with chaperone function